MAELMLTAQQRRERAWRRILLATLWIGALASWGSWNGGVVVAAALLGLMLRAAAPYAAAAAVVSTLAALFDGGLGDRYLDSLRWILVFGGAGILAIRFTLRRGRPGIWKVTLFQLMMAAFAFAAGLSALSSQAPALAFFKALPLSALLVSCFVGAHATVVDYGSGAARRFCEAMLMTLAPFLFLAFASWALGFSPTVGDAYLQGSFRGLSGNPNSFAAGAAFVVPYLFAVVAATRGPWRKPAVAAAAVGGALTYLLLLSRSRAGTLALAVAVAVLFSLHLRSKLPRLAIPAPGLTLAMASVQPNAAVERVVDWLYKGKTERSLLASRLTPWRLSMESFLESPWVGNGFGITGEREIFVLDQSRLRQIKIEQGSSFWALLAQVGVTGSLPIFVALVEALVRGLRFAIRVRDPYFSVLVAASFGGLANSLFEGWMVSPGNGLLWMMIMQCSLIDAVTARLRPPGRLRRSGARSIVPPPRARERTAVGSRIY